MRKTHFNRQAARHRFALLAVLAAMALATAPTTAFSQVFLWDEETGSYRAGMSASEFNIVPYQGGDADQYLPLGDGLLLLTGLGGGYGLAKRKKSKSSRH